MQKSDKQPFMVGQSFENQVTSSLQRKEIYSNEISLMNMPTLAPP